MGILSGFEKGLESELMDLYTSYFMSTGVSKKEAEEMVSSMIISAKNEAKQEGTNNLPFNYGELLLEKEKTDNSIQKMFKDKRTEGVTDEDIIGWWNLHDLERRMTIKNDELTQFTMFKYFIENPQITEMNEEEIHKYAADKVKKYNPIYGDNESSEDSDNRKLPYELKERVNKYGQKRMNDEAEYKEDIEYSSSFNALVRKEIKRGRL